MRAVIQRVSSASVTIEADDYYQSIDHGLVVLLGIAPDDTHEDVDWLAKKIVQMRIFNDEADKMNLSLQDVGGSLLIISQFTLLASTKKGNRPSFIKSAKPEQAIPLYEAMISAIQSHDIEVKQGQFGAEMDIALVNQGPVTITIDTKLKE